jgi:hypothetical protein
VVPRSRVSLNKTLNSIKQVATGRAIVRKIATALARPCTAIGTFFHSVFVYPSARISSVVSFLRTIPAVQNVQPLCSVQPPRCRGSVQDVLNGLNDLNELEREQSNLRNVDKITSGPELNALIAEQVMGWRSVERQDGRYWGQKQDKAGRWRRTTVRNYCKNPTDAYLIDERIKQLGLSEKYRKELTKITRAKKIPVEWASPDQRCRAALKTVKK